MTIEHVINKPTAAVIAYGIDKRDKEENILVFDLGGRTFDVTLLSIDNGSGAQCAHGRERLFGKYFTGQV